MPDESSNEKPKKDSLEPSLSPIEYEDLISTVTKDEDEIRNETFRIGQYQVLRKIGGGGMGTVYLGIRADQEFKKRVAIKLIRKGMDSSEIITRFRTERQILASLDHPNIAKLLDGGTTDEGLPYFVMERIQGWRLTDYCDSHDLRTKERLQLFRTICQAVHYAHQNLVVHRDLKPGNILITADGIPKLLDFGIAKLLNPDTFSQDSPPTATHMRVMTPEYASPEQVKGEPITTSSDIYSLGVILYELLSGRRPYQITSRSYMEMYRVVCEMPPAKPSIAVTKNQEKSEDQPSQVRGTTPKKLQKELQGDLDNIILMTLRKEPNKRYASVEALSEDIRRHMEGHPVQARKGTWTYRASKYVRRHTAGLAAAAIVFLLLLAFAATTAVQNVRIAQQRDLAKEQKAKAEAEAKKAEAEAEKAEKVTQFLTELFEVNDPAKAKGENLTARQILDRGAQKIQSEMKAQPEVQAKMMSTLGVIYQQLGLYDQAMPLFQDALKIRKELHGSEHITVAESLGNLGYLLFVRDQLDEAERLQREALAMNRRLLGNEHPDVAKELRGLANILSHKGNLNEAERLHREALTMDRKLHGSEHIDVAKDLRSLASDLYYKGQLDEAEQLFREALTMDRKLLGNEHPDVANGIQSLAITLMDEGKLNEAEQLFREALALNRKLLGSEHPEIARNITWVALVLWYRAQLDEAEKLFREALAMRRKLLGSEHTDVASAINNLANVLRDKGNLDEAVKLYAEAVAMNRKLLGNEHPLVAAYQTNLAEVLFSKGQKEAAISQLKETLSIPIEKMPEDNKFRARAKGALGVCYLAQNRYADAEPLLLDAYRVLSVQEKGAMRTKMLFQRTLELYKAWGKPDKANTFREAAKSENAE
jgi:serine/threonine protein kinase/tetratricopeptide (TPR) repeat protein